MTGAAPVIAAQSGRGATDVTRSSPMWTVFALAVVLVAAFGVRYGTRLGEIENVRDERLMKVPIDTILRDGWSVQTAIDYQEVKGPVFFWCYSIAGEFLGGDIHSLRLASVLFFVLGAWPLLLIARRAGLAGPLEPAAAGLYVLMPYHLPQGQLLMSEASFIFFALWMLWAFVWGLGASRDEERRVWGPVLFGVLLSVLLHHRPHAVALAAAVALVAWERDGARCWPWWLACGLAGLSRLPLWVRWGGLVTSDYQGLFGFGLRPDGLTYALAAALPATAIFIWPVLRESRFLGRRRWLLIGGLTGLVLGAVAAPDLAAKVHYELPGTGEAMHQAEYAGIVATLTTTLFRTAWLQWAALAGMAGLAGASISALGVAAWSRSVQDERGVVGRLSFWTLAFGLPLYAIAAGPVYDRYVLVWIVLLPVVWTVELRPRAMAVQMLMLGAIAVYFVGHYFT